ncbi:hypothetical protein N0V88_008133 [Collariella sp. IMI 366227]|nr:hypothetical protein N0V88_008133 [Collariella sp. IMI 366227]
MADPTLIACLYPSGNGQEGLHGIDNALRTIQMNESRRFEPLREDFSRCSSLAPDDGDDINDTDNDYDGGDGDGDDQEEAPDSGHDYSPGLRLGFDDERKSSLGILIGTSPKCDIVLPKRDSLSGISPYHCTITFDEQGRLILKDLQNPEDQRRRKRGRTAFMPGTAVTYNGKGGQKRCAFTWILGDHEFTADNQPIVIALHDNLKFQIVVAPQDIHSSSYKENVARFLSGPSVCVDDLSLGQLGLWSMSSTAEQSGAQSPSEMQPPSKDAILLDGGELGRGGFAVVIRVWNVSTGLEYASKEPLKKRHWEYLEREINVLKGIHNSISRVSKPTALDRKYTKRRERGDYAPEEVAYFFDKFSNPLHPLYRSQVEAVADGAGESVVLLDWYNGPAWTEPPRGAPRLREDSVEHRVCLSNPMENWDEIGTAAKQVETATEAIGSPLAQTLGGVLPLESGV